MDDINNGSFFLHSCRWAPLSLTDDGVISTLKLFFEFGVQNWIEIFPSFSND
jgi:hypothetical protein